MFSPAPPSVQTFLTSTTGIIVLVVVAVCVVALGVFVAALLTRRSKKARVAQMAEYQKGAAFQENFQRLHQQTTAAFRAADKWNEIVSSVNSGDGSLPLVETYDPQDETFELRQGDSIAWVPKDQFIAATQEFTQKKGFQRFEKRDKQSFIRGLSREWFS